MGIGIAIKDEVTTELQRKLKLLKDQSPFWNRVAVKMHRSIKLNFKHQGRPTKWKPSRRALSQGGTRKDGTEVSGETLVDTGLLRASIGWRIDKASAAIGVQNVGEKLKGTQFGSVKKGAPIIGSQVKYGRAHQKGFSGAVQIKEHDRTVSSLFGKVLPEPITFKVKAHTRNMKIPKREFILIQTQDQAEIMDMLDEYLS